MTSLRKKEREYSVLKVVAGRVGDETLMTPSRASLAPTGGRIPNVGARLAREGNFKCSTEMKLWPMLPAGVSDPTL
jgi:hypothetical protein